MTDNPFINKQNWGRDLLDRLNNFSDNDGSFNVWDELPTTGKDGQSLNESHRGLTGILTSSSTSTIKKWTGTEWEVVISLPFSVAFSENDVNLSSINLEADICVVEQTSEKNCVYALLSNNNGVIRVNKYNNLGTQLWTSSTSLPGGTQSFQTNGVYGKSIISFNNRIFINIIPLPTAATSWLSYLTNRTVICMDANNGTFYWSSQYTQNTSYAGYSTLSKSLSGDLIVVQPELGGVIRFISINAANGQILGESSVSGHGDISYIQLFADTSSNNYFGFTDVFWSSCLIQQYSTSLNSVTFSQSAVTLNRKAFYYATYVTAIDPANSNLLYVLDITDDGNSFEISSYNNTTRQFQSLGILQNLPAKTNILGLFAVDRPSIGGIKFVLFNQQTLFECSIIGNQIIVNDVLLPAGQGLILKPVESIGFSKDDLVVKTRFNRLGYLPSLDYTILNIALARPKNIKVNFPKAIISNNQNDFELISDFNVDSFYAKSALIPRLSCESIQLNNYVEVSTQVTKSSLLPSNDWPIGFSTQNKMVAFHLYSGNISNESHGFGGGNSLGAGLLLGCRNIGGRIISGAPNYASGAIVQDFLNGRLFICSQSSNTNYGLLTGFPNANGIVVTSANNIGIGTQSPTQKVQVVGTLQATTIMNSGGVITSDPRLKTNMVSLPGNDLWEVCQALNPISFLYRSDLEIKIQEIKKDENNQDEISIVSQKWPLPQSIQYGYNATEVEQLFPELISEDSQGIKYLNSGALFPIFQSAAVAKINSLEAKIESLEFAIASLITRIEVLENA